MSKKNIAVLYGGDSSEAVISLKSGKMVMQSIDTDKYNAYGVFIKGTDWHVDLPDGVTSTIDKNDFSAMINNQKVKCDCAAIIIHGTPGENGLLQSYFEMLHIPHTTCSAFVSALTFDKYACKTYLRDLGITMAREVLVKTHHKVDSKAIVDKLGLPVFVKPNAGGSSFGVTKVKTIEELDSAVKIAQKEGAEVIIEEFIKGREFSHGVMKALGKTIELPITEIVSKKEFFDVEAKYQGMSDEITPAQLDNSIAQRMKQESLAIYDWLNCAGIVRVDYIVRDNDIFFLEINTVPGMSEMSIVPQQIRYAGLTFSEALTLLIDDSIARYS